ncbi:Invasion associated locus B family protein, partial [Mesorhizobium sp. M7A.F.Ca.CA.004.09.1.2]
MRKYAYFVAMLGVACTVGVAAVAAQTKSDKAVAAPAAADVPQLPGGGSA